jgi:hypothetical protein
MTTQLVLLVWLHFIGDFILQSDNVAKQKSKSNLTLLLHIAQYSLPFFTLAIFNDWFGLTANQAVTFIYVNAALHFITDYVSSRLTSYFWQKEDRHNFFVVIGADQAIHMTCLIGTYLYLLV